MTETKNQRRIDHWDGVTINPGESRDVELRVGESYSGMTVSIPLHVCRGKKAGPTIFVTAALHGNEINGTGAIRTLIQDENLQLDAGALVLVPVLNPLGFDRHSRYLPDRRDLNRCFPGSATGSLASRLARIIFDEIVARCDYGVDLHTAAERRTNFPNVRADWSNGEVRQLAEAFGCEMIVCGEGPKSLLRREACAAGCATIVLEAGEVWKVEPSIVECALRGIRNVLMSFEMIEGTPEVPLYQVVTDKTKWIRADRGGFLQFHVAPGEVVGEGEPLATNTSLLGHEQNVLTAPFDGIVIGMTTLPAVSPGEPVIHLGKPAGGTRQVKRARRKVPDEALHERVMGDLASNVMVVDRVEGS